MQSQTYVAQQLGVSQGTYRQYEEGTIAVSIDRLIDIANFYNLPISAFFEDEERPGGSDGRPTGQKTGQISPETAGTVQEEARTGQKTGQTSPDAPLCTVSITINVNTDKDKRKVGQILQLLQ